MNKNKLMGIVGGCIVVAIVVLVVATQPGPRHTLDVSISPPGAGSVSPSGGEHESWAEIILTAIPAGNYVFTSWTGDVDTVTNIFAATTTITMSSDCSIMANFLEAQVAFPNPNVGVAIRGDISERGYLFPSDVQDHNPLH